MKLLITITFIFLFTLCANAQTDCQTVEICQSQLSEASRMINKLLDVNKANEGIIEAQREQIGAQAKLNAINSEIILKYKAKSADQEKLINLLEKRSQRKLKILFGLISVRF